ncbi:hypothetical protein [Sediminimonas sp.]|uniref:hypothetical protein n=1 Tax=Sediminimonas sp. TaxID=2823379 RepID=UPI0025F72BF5|nr:hypothetical protein [Sediminimonas sp.]
MRSDLTFNDGSAYGSVSWAAQRLGMTKDQFSRKREALKAEGFPEKDHVTDLYHKSDVDAWIAQRRRIPDASAPSIYQERTREEINLNAV